jgi:DHA1 family tetracycline resistance protein-like MFS transporter
MTNLFSYFSSSSSSFYFPGAPFLAGALLFSFSTIISYRSLQAEKKAVPF